MTHSDIIARLEKATGPDRELDARIWAHLHGVKYIAHNMAYAPYNADNPRTQVSFTLPPKRTRMVTGLRGYEHAEPWTSSLDATVALVEKQGFLWLRKSFNSMTVTRPLTEEQDARKEWAKHFDAAGATPAIALLIALFRALPSGEPANG